MPPPVAIPGVHVKYKYVVLFRKYDFTESGSKWYAQNNEDPGSPVELGPDNRLSDILAHFGDEGFVIATSGGIDAANNGPTRLILVRAEFGNSEPQEKESPFLGDLGDNTRLLQGEEQ